MSVAARSITPQPQSVYKQIVFLASFPKSGNTWVRLFLDAYFLGEIDINEMVVSIADDNARRHQIGDGSDIRKLPIHIQNLTRPMALLRLVRTWNAEHVPGVPLYVKTHAAHMVANGIEQLPHDLTKSVVYLVRDPRDVVVSFAKHMGQTIDEAIDAMDNKHNVLAGDPDRMKVADIISSWSNNVRSYWLADTHNVLRMRYEDLKEAPEEAFGRILAHSGVEPDPDRVKTALELTRLDRLREQEKEQGFRESSPHAENQFFGTGGGWQDKLTDAQRHKVERRFGRMMKKVGYL